MVGAVVLVGAALAAVQGRVSPIGDGRPTLALDGQRLQSGVQGITPQPTFSITLDQRRAATDYQAALDGQPVQLVAGGSGAASLKLPQQAQGSWHHLDVWRRGSGGRHEDEVRVDFRIVEPLRLAVAWLSTPGATRAALTWSRPPADVQALAAVMRAAGASVDVDDRSAVGTWSGSRSAQRPAFTVPAGTAAADGSFLPTAFAASSLAGPAPAAVQLSDPPHADISGLKLQMYYVSTPAARADLAQHARQVAVLSPSFYAFDSGGNLQRNIDATALATALGAGVSVEPLVTNADFDRGTAQALVGDPSRWDAMAGQLVDEARRRGYHGYQLDFENLSATDHEGLSGMSRALAARLSAAGLNYSVAVIPRRASSSLSGQSAAYDYRQLAGGAGWQTLMAYDQHTRQEDPGPVAGLDWVRQVAGFTTSGLDPAHVYLGVPLYGRDFSPQGVPTARGYSEAIATAAANSGTLSWEFDTATLRASYLAGGVQHTEWIDNRASLEAKLAYAGEQHMAGVSAWRLGFEDPDFWSLWPSR
jgi:spore germination protein YaaH